MYSTMLFSFHRENIEVLIKDLNQQKSCIKKNGIVVDGRHFKVKFTGYCMPTLSDSFVLSNVVHCCSSFLLYLVRHVILCILFNLWRAT